MLGAKQEHYGKKYKNFPNLFSNFDTIYLWRLFGGFMDKQFADQMIEQFQTKFFGFALSKCQNMQEAEELAARITCEAYVTMRQVEEVYNWEGYLYRIASNIYAKYVQEQKKNDSKDVELLDFSDEFDFEKELLHKEELQAIKKEIAWLGKRHREIVILHYYHNKKLGEIAKQLEIPEGTVKWHLSDAKKQLKKGMEQMREKGRLGIEPIELGTMGNIGTPGTLGDINYFLNSKLRKNIVYAAYYEPKTKLEIANELGVSPVFIEDEVDYLEEYGFLDLMQGQKYRTNILIEDIPYEVVLKTREIEKEIAKLVCDMYVPNVLSYLEKVDKSRFYIPNDDWNFFLWSMIPMMVCQIGIGEIDWDRMRKKNYLVKRKDGGDYVAYASVYREEVYDEVFEHKQFCGPMFHGCENVNVGAWSLSTEYDDREFGWEDNLESDYVSLYQFMNGELPKTEGTLDKYVRLYDRGLLANVDGNDVVNVVIQRYQDSVGTNLLKYINEFAFPVSKELKARINQLVEKCIEIEKKYFPKHMQEMWEIYRRFSNINTIKVIDELLERGILKPLTQTQRKGVMIILYSDFLPVRGEV